MPRCSQTDEEPGPPLNENVIGRLDLFSHPIFGVGGEEDLRLGLFALRFLLPIGCFLFQHHRPGDDGVLELLPVDGERVLALDQVIDRGRFFFFFLFLLFLGFLWVLSGHLFAPASLSKDIVI